MTTKKTKKLTRQQAIEQLTRTRTLSTELLEPLGTPFEAFLRVAQLPKDKADKVVETYIDDLNPSRRIS